ncbi:MAG: tetratricopeptide repeat protein [Nostocales cyanobacterium]|nr:MAG: tetratricopeptide repeat protein [Nostocales cyanobacterium]TAF19985.1 MAG: tetratricopeptide repeat protein [Nostocales cyanobacterium]
MSVNETLTTNNFTLNRQTYQRLKFALSIGLRRQIFFAVCDDLHIRNQIATRLHSSLAYPVGQVLYQSSETGGMSTPAYPRLVTLRLNLNDPNPIAQINQWLGNYPPPIVGETKDKPGRPLPIPAFQIVGIELLTKQSVSVQRLFLHYLRLSEQYFTNEETGSFLESTLLFWLPRPWLYNIQQSAPKFWQCRTGVFVFAGEPTPTVNNRNYSDNFSHLRSINLETETTQTAINQEIINNETLNHQNINNETINYESDISQEEINKTIAEFKFIEDDDFLEDSYENLTETEKEETAVQSFTNNQAIPKLSSLLHINHELVSLVQSSLNPNIHENAEENIQPRKILWKIEQLKTQTAPKEEIASAYHQLGNLYRSRIEEGQTSIDNLMVAIIAYQESVSHDDNAPHLPDTLNDLGTLYWMLHRTPGSSLEDSKTYIEQGIEFYGLAIKLITPENQPDIYARVQNNLATAYGDLTRYYNPLENWQKAVEAYNEAIRYRTEENDPLKYAACQNNLGTAYWHLGQYSDPIEHLQKAINAYKSALLYYQPDNEPVKYGMLKNNIGTAYWNLSQHEKPLENLQLAVNFYQEALKYRTPDNTPVACAATRNNLGTAYWHIANLPEVTKEIKQNFLELCIKTYQDTVSLASSLNSMQLTFDLLATYNNLGLAHYTLVTDPYFKGEKTALSQHLESALASHVQALSGLVNNPEAYQATFNHVVKVIRTFHNELGIQGQNLALSKVPSNLIPEILPKL